MGRIASPAFCFATVLLALLFLTSPASHAAPPTSVTYTDSFGLTTPAQTNWTNVTLHLPQFDPALGMLNSIHIDLHASANGTLKLESRDSAADTLIANLTDTVSIQRPDGTTFTSPLAVAHITPSLSKYDGNTDFSGTSGLTFVNSASNDEIINLTSNSPGFDSFIGTGSIPLLASASGATNLSGVTNLASSIRSFAEADLSVTYNYSFHPTLPIPEPTGLGALLLATFLAFRPKRS